MSPRHAGGGRVWVERVDETETVEVERRRRRRWPLVLGAVLLLLLLALLIAWLLRFTIAADFIDRELARRGVDATYQVKRIGFRRQRLENLVIGDPRAPDLTARWVEIELSWGGFRRPKVALITARGVRMRGRIVDGRVSLGQVDRLLPPPSGLPFRLPDQRIDVADAAIRLDTPAGPVGIGLQGRGNLSNGFRGHMAAVGRSLRFRECLVTAPRAAVAVSVDRLRPTFRGPVLIERVRCEDDFALARPRFEVDVTLAQAFDSWTGRGRVEAAGMQAGPHRLAALRANLTVEGNIGDMRGRIDLASGPAAVASFRAAASRVTGTYALSPRHGNVALSGDIRLRGLTLTGPLRPVAAALRSVDGTPVGPIGRQLADALIRAGESGADARARLHVANRGGRGDVRFADLDVTAGSGARLRAVAGSGITFSWPSNALRTDGDFTLGGGGFPAARFTLRQARPGGAIQGVGRIAPMAAGGSQLALGEVRFTAGPDGTTRIDTVAVISGPFRGGRIEGLAVPISGRLAGGGFAFGETCLPASFRRFQYQGLVLGPSRLPLCPTGRALVWKAPGGSVQLGGELRGPRFSGTLGRTPIAVEAGAVRFSLTGSEFAARDVAVRLGRDPSVHLFRAAELGGRFARGGVSGAFGGLSARIAAVPLHVDEGAGRWQVRGGDLALEGRILVSDERDPARFNPVVSDDFRLTLARNRIHATGWTKHPASGTRILHATIDHDLGTGAGRASLDVPGIRFAPDGLQPEHLTRLTVGVIALVEATLTGRGEIAWRPGSTTSTGTFSTRGANFAAAFGPVEGLTTTIRFTDLLRLESAPGQIAQIAMIRAGIDVSNGTIRYQLRPGSQVQIEGGQWPFAGGELLLQPTLLDFSKPETRYLTFQVVGLQAAQFVDQAGLTAIDLTGIFDGVLPMQFDVRGARIVGGRLEARPGGGTLSYAGIVNRANMPAAARLAFDALRSMRYSRLEIRLDGALAGEFLSRIRLEGLSAANRQNFIVRQLARIPFRFNISIRGPLRAVIGITRDMKDPSILIQPVLPEALQGLPTTVTTIQNQESEVPQ
ncbi:MAG TPA: YdbH domain-containing protein [Allosphingosinicella sp.]|nr:YdbH domain-containing protein [Allosphingosinicella sp.]